MNIKARFWFEADKKMVDWCSLVETVLKIRLAAERRAAGDISYTPVRRAMASLEGSLMLWTGLRDRAGTDIFEGDIVQSACVGVPVEVRWSESAAGFILCREEGGILIQLSGGIGVDRGVDRACLVIGNIYQNPALRNAIRCETPAVVAAAAPAGTML